MTEETVELRRRPRLGLALGGGVARGWAHIGVVRRLVDNGLMPDVVAGTSIGAVVGGIYLAGKLDVLETWVRGLNRIKVLRYLDFRMSHGGLIGGDRLRAEMERYLDGLTIDAVSAPFRAIATDLITGHEVWLGTGRLVDALKASFALPGVFPPMMIDGRWLVDGALVNPVPVSACRALGAELVIAVNLNADPFGKARRETDASRSLPVETAGTAPTGSLTAGDLLALFESRLPLPSGPGLLDGFARRLFRRSQHGPSLLGVMMGSLGIILDRITRARMAADPADVQIAPRLGHIGMLEFDRSDEMIAEGAAAVDRALPEIKGAFAMFGGGLPDDG